VPRSSKETAKRSIGKAIPSWWHFRGPERQSGRQWRPRGRSRSTPGPRAQLY
jgi:hypothetical protein